MQMYCTFVLFVSQYFPGLLASGTHCIIPNAKLSLTYCEKMITVLMHILYKYLVLSLYGLGSKAGVVEHEAVYGIEHHNTNNL
jgi:hypothetical protein